MIFKGHLELKDIVEYRNRALKRKFALVPDIKGIGQYEFEFLECFERLIELYPEFPYVLFCETDELYNYKSRRVFSTVNKEGCYTISYSCGDIGEFQKYTNLIFGKPWSECKIDVVERNGKPYKPYEYSVYSFPYFSRFECCRLNVEKYVNKMSIWFKSLHEYAHIINGHIDLKAAMLNGDEEYNVELLRAMELHADMTAASYMLIIMKQWKKYVGCSQIVKQTNGKDPGISFCDDVVFAAVAAYLALRSNLTSEYWDEFTVGIHEMNKETHPLTELRMLVVYNVFLLGVIEYGDEYGDGSGFGKTLYNAIVSLEDFFYKNCASEKEKREIYRPKDLLRTKKGKAYYQKMFDSVMRLGCKLKDYEIVGNEVSGEWLDYETLPEMDFWE